MPEVGKVVGSVIFNPNNPRTGGAVYYRSIANRIDVSTIGAHLLDGLPGEGSHVVVPRVQTDYRFCQPNAALRVSCTDKEILQNSVLDGGGATAAQEAHGSRAQPWHRIQVEVPAVVPNRDAAPDLLQYGTDAPSRTWDYKADDAFWRQHQLIPPSEDYPECVAPKVYGDGTCLRGRIWVHAATDVGKDAAHSGVVGAHGPDLSNYYVEAIPDEATLYSHQGLGNPRNIWTWETLPDPGPDVDPALRDVARRHEAVVLLSAGEFGAGELIAAASRRQLDPGAFLSAGVQAAMRTDENAFVSSSDPARALNQLRDHPVAILLRHNGGAVVDNVQAFNGALALESETRLLQSLFTSSSPADAGTLASAASNGPTARTEYLATYSAYAGKLFVVGGRATDSGAPLNDAWKYDVETSEWTPVAAPALRQIRAATYVFADGSLWVLDMQEQPPHQRHKRGRGEARLLRIDTWAGTATVIATWHPTNVDHYYLTTLADGGLLLSGTQADERAPERFTMLQLSAGTRPVVTGRKAGRGRLLAAPFVDEQGIGLLIGDRDGTVNLEHTMVPAATRPELERTCEGEF
jgi:hypothetical protein